MLLTDADPIAAARAEFAPTGTYLDTATMGLPPAASLRALREVQDAWGAGTLDARRFDADIARARAAFAALVGVPAAGVAIGSQVSAFAGLLAASLPRGAEVLCAEGDFTSILFPFLAQEARGVRVKVVPRERVTDAIGAGTALVAVSAAHSSDGWVQDLDALADAADHHGAPVFLDATQACGWLPVDAARFAFVVAGAYKWLLSPRGAAFLAIAPDHLDTTLPHAAGWYAGQDPWDSIYGTPLRLASDARRFDVSPAWFCWAGAAPALELLAATGVEAIGAHNLGLANRFRAGLGLPTGDSAIVAVDVPDAAARLEAAGVRASVRAGRVRASFHLYTTEADVDRALNALS
jgi:selenocysteine lyase/cysteine desulfurase